VQKEKLLRELKELIVVECDKEDDVAWEDLQDAESLMGPEARLGLDSLDALQVSVAVGQRYGVRIGGAKEAREALVSIDALAEYILREGNA
jgi:acyl carrier protein